MCNRISTPSSKEIKKKFPGLNVQDFEASYHTGGWDQTLVPIVTNEKTDLVQQARWGFVPKYAKSIDSMAKPMCVNARSEDMFDNMHKESALTKRCIVFLNGYYEFRDYQGTKYPHYISKEDGHLFTVGGLWSEWQGLLTCTIITVPANPLIAQIHNGEGKHSRRMPLILQQAQWERWFDTNLSREEVTDMMQSYSIDDIIAWQVGDMVTDRNVSDKNVPEIRKPFGPILKKVPLDAPVPLPEKEKPVKKGKPKQSPPDQLGLF